MTGRIRISGIQVRARHGVFESEKTTDQLFIIDLDLGVDVSAAIESDSIEDTVDYGDLARRTRDFASSRSFDLIESLAAGIATVAMEDPRVDDVTVTVHKPEAPMDVPFSDVAVSINRPR